MTSDFSASASSQQPFPRPHPHPAPVQTAVQAATSPPTKQSLKSWWKTFRPPAKNQETHAQPAAGIFGVPLRQSITYANVAISLVDGEGKSYIYGYVPIVVAKCGVYLKEKATNVEGIFRLSGSEKRIKELRTIFDSPDRYGKGLDWAGYTVHDAANVLRRYLNQLPEPIVPLDLYDRFRAPLKGHTKQAVGDIEGPQLPDNFDIRGAIETYQRLITELPPLNRQLLLYILDLLAVFASKSDENRMTSQNLAAIFQPGMLSHPSHDMAPSEYRLSQDVLIFLIENQDHFLIGMRGTAADEQTVNEVQNGGTPPPGTPNTPGRSKTTVGIGRSSSNGSAAAESIRKYGGVRRNVSVSSRNSRQSNGAPSPASPAYGTSLTSTTSASGVHRSNTVPSKRSPGLNTSSRLQKHSGSQSPTGPNVASPQRTPTQATAPRGLSPAVPSSNSTAIPSSLSAAPVTLENSKTPLSQQASAVTSKERLLGEQPEDATPAKERNVSGFFNRPPTGGEGDKRPANKLRKKKIPSSSNPSAQSSTHSLHTPHPTTISPGLPPSHFTHQVADHPRLESAPASNPILSSTAATPSVETPRADQSGHQLPGRPEEPHQSSDNTLKPLGSPASSLNSRSSFNDQSDLDHHYTSDSAAFAEKKEKHSKWRLSRHHGQTPSVTLSPRKGLGSDPGTGTSTSSVGSSGRPRKSFTGDTIPVGSDPFLMGTHQQWSNESNPALGGEEKKGPFGWIKNKMREKKEESKDKDADKGRNKSPPASTDRLRGKSMDVRRDEPRVPPLPTASSSFPISPPPVAQTPTTSAPAPPPVPQTSTTVAPPNPVPKIENAQVPQRQQPQR